MTAASRIRPVRPWEVVEVGLDCGDLGFTESNFALANGHVGVRGALEEGPWAAPGAYVAGFYDVHPLHYGERRAGYPTEGESALRLGQPTTVRVRLDEEPLDLRTGRVRRHVRVLDMRAGTLARHTVWESPGGRRLRIRSERLVSLDDPHVVALVYEAAPLDAGGELALTSELPTILEMASGGEGMGSEESPVLQEPPPADVGVHGSRAAVCHTAAASGLAVAVATDHRVLRGEVDGWDAGVAGDAVRMVATSRPAAGQALMLLKVVAYHLGPEERLHQLRDEAVATVDRAIARGFGGLLAGQRRALDCLWADGDVVVEGDPPMQQGARFCRYQLMQATAHAGDRAIPSRGLTGARYRGHAMWDLDAFMLPALAYSDPERALGILRFRYAGLEFAKRRAADVGLRGALFPWRTISGTDSSTYFPAGTAKYHLAADVAQAVRTYVDVTGDEGFERGPGAELLVETARLWTSLGHYSVRVGGRFSIHEVTGPDEYTALVDDNLYTNLMAAANLADAAATVRRLAARDPEAHAALARRTGLQEGEPEEWERASDLIHVPYDEDLGIHSQDARFLQRERWDLAALSPDQFPLYRHHHPLTLYRYQVIKQPDLVLALHVRGERFSLEEKRRAFRYYEPLTAGDSSLAHCTRAVVAAEVGDMEAALRHARRTARIDLDGETHDAERGVHLAASAGAWIALVAGMAGLRRRGHVLHLRPSLPEGWRRLRFALLVRGARLLVDVTPARTTYRLSGATGLTLMHRDVAVALRPGEERTLSTAAPPGPARAQRRGVETPPVRHPAPVGRAREAAATSGDRGAGE